MQLPLRVLVIEDYRDIRETYAVYLRNDGMIVDEAASLRDTIPMLAGTNYDAIMLDLALPDAKGTEAIKVCRVLADKPGTPPTAIVVVTGADISPLDAIAAGADDFISKGQPITAAISAIEKVRFSHARNVRGPHAEITKKFDKVEDLIQKLKDLPSASMRAEAN